MKMRLKIIGTVMLAITIIVIGTTFLTMKTMERTVRVAQEKDLLLIADIVDRFISAKITNLKFKSSILSKVIGAEYETEMCNSIIRDILINDEFIGLLIINKDGEILRSAGPSPALPDIIYREDILKSFDGETIITSTVPTDDGVRFYVSSPMYKIDDTIFILTLPGQYFSEKASSIQVWDTGSIFIDDHEGHVIANVRPEWVESRINFIHLSIEDPEYIHRGNIVRRAIKGETGVEEYSVENIPRLMAFRPITTSDEGWFLGVVAPISESPFNTVNRGLITSGTLSFIFSLLIMIFSSRFLQKVFNEILTMKEHAERNSRYKSDFLANMSHEIRTPMNVILGHTEIQLNDPTISNSTRTALEMIHNSGELLLSIINDILDLSKIEADKLKIMNNPCEIASLINDTTTLNIMNIGDKKIKFQLIMDENIPEIILGDELRLKQILNNVLSNAFKYTNEGIVTLGVNAKVHSWNPDEESYELTLVLTVTDTGLGMTEEQVKEIFSRYTRFQTKELNPAGTGLGLNITQKLVHLMNGEIVVESKVGEGSTFTIYIPMKSVGQSVVGKELVENLQKFDVYKNGSMKRARILFEPMPYGNILIVDDMESNLAVIKGLLSPYQLSVDTAMSGKEAITKIEDGYEYNVIFMDYRMPDMDGIEAVQVIRKMGYPNPIVALTANTIVGQSDLFLSSGFDEFLSKPIDTRILNDILKKFILKIQPQEILESARSNTRPTKIVDSDILKAFIKDATRVIENSENICKNNGNISPEDTKKLAISIHGIKSSLLNIGESSLSDVARKLEMMLDEGKIDEVLSRLPCFMLELKDIITGMKVE